MKTLLIICILCTPALGKGFTLKRKVHRTVKRSVCVDGNCARVTSVQRTRTVERTAQKIAETKAAHAAYYGIKGHCLRHLGFGGGTFEGCGWASHGNPSTCTPRGGKVLIADARSKGRDGWYRYRIWR